MFHGTRALRHRNYRLFFGGQAVSLIGTWMQQVAQGWLVLQLTHDPWMLGVIAVAQFGPVVVFGLFGGVLADQLPKRRTLVWTQAAAMVLAFAMFGLTASGVVEVWHIVILAVLLGFVNAVDMPTRQAFAVEMVGRDDMTNAVGLNSALFNGSRIVGPAIAGLLIGWFDISIAFLINGISFIAVIAAYRLMRDEDLRPPPKVARPTTWAGVVENLAEGVSYVRRTPLVLLAVSVVGLGATFGMNFSVLAPPLADHVLHVGATGFGFLMAATGIGSTAAALWVAFAHRPRPRNMVIGAVTLGLGSVALAWSTSFVLSLLAMAFVGAGGMAMAVTANATIQLAVPDQLRGRVMSVYTTVFSGSVPAGGLLMGALASRFNVPLAFAVGGWLTLAVGIGAWYWLRRLEARGEARLPSRKLVPDALAGAEASTFTSARPR
jgi:MFS family permease